MKTILNNQVHELVFNNKPGPIPNYAGDIRAAMRVVNTLRQKLPIDIRASPFPVNWTIECGSCCITDPNLCHAICLLVVLIAHANDREFFMTMNERPEYQSDPDEDPFKEEATAPAPTPPPASAPGHSSPAAD